MKASCQRGVALVTTLLVRHSQVHQHYLADHITPTNPLAMDMITRYGGGAGGLRAVYGIVQQQASILSYLDLFRMFAFAIVLVAPLVLFMRRAAPVKGEMVAH